MMRCSVAAAVTFLFIATPCVRAEDSDEVKRLKERIEILETKLELAEKENGLLRKEIELLKGNEPSPGKTSTKKSLSERLPEGTVITGVYIQVGVKGTGEITLTVTGRDGNKIKGTTHLKFTDSVGKVIEKDGDVEGEINGTLLNLKSVGRAVKTNLTVSLKGDALEGRWSSSAGGKGAVGFKLAR
jgi:hypothetical protein